MAGGSIRAADKQSSFPNLTWGEYIKEQSIDVRCYINTGKV